MFEILIFLFICWTIFWSLHSQLRFDPLCYWIFDLLVYILIFRSSDTVFSEGYQRYLTLCLTLLVSPLVRPCVSVFWRRCAESYSVAIMFTPRAIDHPVLLGSNKAHIALTTTSSLIEVWHWRPKSCLNFFMHLDHGF